jgi:hypothetical protein
MAALSLAARALAVSVVALALLASCQRQEKVHTTNYYDYYDSEWPAGAPAWLMLPLAAMHAGTTRS